MTYDEWLSREPDQFTAFKVGEFQSTAEAELVARAAECKQPRRFSTAPWAATGKSLRRRDLSWSNGGRNEPQ
jgi:hypothetical protein